MLRKYFFAVIFVITGLFSYAQSQLPTACGINQEVIKSLVVRTLTTEGMHVCGNDIQFTVEMENTSTSDAVSIIETTNILLPIGIRYSESSLTGATLINNPSLSPNTGKQLISVNGILGGASIPVGGKVSFTFRASGKCDVLTGIQDAGAGQVAIRNETRVCYTVGNSSVKYTIDETLGSGSYNVLFPSLEISMTENNSKKFGTIGDYVTRQFTITNSGFGSIDMSDGFVLKVNYPSDKGLEYRTTHPLEASSSGISDITFTESGTTTTKLFLVKGAGTFDKNEIITITENIKVKTCNESHKTDYVVEWGCDNSVCNSGQNNAKLSSYINRPVNLYPSVSAEKLNEPEFTYCSGDKVPVRVKFTNLGDATTNSIYPLGNKATNAVVRWRTYSNSGTNYQVTNLKIKDRSTGSFVALPVSLLGGTIVDRYIYFSDRLTTDPDGPGGIEDVDNDGYYDDIAVGESIELEGEVIMNGCPFTSTETSNLSQYNSEIKLEYSDACYLNRRASNTLQRYQNSQLNSRSIKGPIDVRPGEVVAYTFNINRTESYVGNLGSNECLNSEIRSVITLPVGMSPTNPSDLSNITWNGSSSTISPSYDPTTNTITIIGGGVNGNYNVPLVLNCAAATSYESNIHWRMTRSCGTTNCGECVSVWAEQNYPFYAHCPSCAGFHTSDFDVERTTFGFEMPSKGYYTKAEIEDPSTPKVTASPNIAIDKGLEYDIIKAVIPGYYDGTSSYNNAHVQVKFTTSIVDEAILEFLSGTAEIVDGTNVYQAIVTSAALPTSLGGGTYEFDLNIDISNVPGQLIQPGYQINVKEAKFRFIKTSSTVAAGTYQLQEFRAAHFGLNTLGAKADACESFGDNFTFIKKQLYPNSLVGVGDNCTMFRDAWLRVSGGTNDDFPNEFRPLGQIQSVKYAPVNQITVKTDGVNLHNWRYGWSSLSSGSGNPYIWNKVSTDRVSDYYSAGVEYEIVRLSVESQCQMDPTTYTTPYNDKVEFTYTIYDYTRAFNGATYVETISTNGDGTTVSTVNEEHDYRNSVYEYNNGNRRSAIDISADQIQEGYSQTVTWPVYLTNRYNSTSNTWLRIKQKTGNTGKIRTIMAHDAANSSAPLNVRTAVDPTNNDWTVFFVEAGDLNGGERRQINLVATYEDCEENALDEFEVLGSWSCSGYPQDILNPSCIDPSSPNAFSTFGTSIFLRYKTAGLDIVVDDLHDEVDLCQEQVYYVTIRGDKYADMSNLKLRVELPDGVVPSNQFVSYKYPSNSTLPFSNVSNVGNIMFTMAGGKTAFRYEYLISPFITKYSGILPGSRVVNDGITTNDFDNEILFEVRVKTTCPNFDQGFPVRFFTEGTTNCNEPITPRSRQLKIKRRGFEPDELQVQLSNVNNSSLSSCGGGLTVNVGVSNLRNVATVYDNRVIVSIPAGVAVSNTNGGTLTPNPICSGCSLLTWTIPAGLPATNGIANFSFQAALSDINLTGNIQFYGFTRITSNDVVCISSLETCQLQTTTSDPADLQVPINSDAPVVSIVPSETIVCLGTGVNLTSSVSYPSGNSTSYSCSWSGGGYTSTNCNPRVLPAVTTTYTLTITDSRGCEAIAQQEIRIHPQGSISVSSTKGTTCQYRNDGIINFKAATNSGASQITIRLLSGATLIESKVVDKNSLELFENLAIGDYTLQFTDITGCVYSTTAQVKYEGPVINGLCASKLPCLQNSGTSTFKFKATRAASGSSGYTYSIFNGSILMTDIHGNSSFSGTWGSDQSIDLANTTAGVSYTVDLLDNYVPPSGNTICSVTAKAKVETLVFSVAPDDQDIGLCYITEQRPVKFKVSNNEFCAKLPDISYKYNFYKFNELTQAYDISVGNPVTTTSPEYETPPLGLGKYQISVTMLTNGYEACATSNTFEMEGKSTFTVAITPFAPLCSGSATGRAEATVSGGFSTINYEWKNLSTGEILSTTSVVDGLVTGGDYGLMVKDSKGCIDPYYHTFMVPAGPPALENPVINDLDKCDANATVTGGTAPYTFAWYKLISSGATTNRVLVNNDRVESSDPVSQLYTSLASGLRSGLYEVVATDANGCTSSSQQQINQPVVTQTYNICMGWSTYKGVIPNPPVDPTYTLPPPPPVDVTDIVLDLEEKVEECVKREIAIVAEEYKKRCFNASNVNDILKLNYDLRYEHITLYYYDRGGRLTQTVPPKGVQLVNPPSNNVRPSHTYLTNYEYNSLGQLEKQSTPDGGITNFVYDNIGRLRYSQNAKQLADGKFSYTNYDLLGRIIEVAEATDDFNTVDAGTTYNASSAKENSYTVYTEPASWISYLGQVQRHLRNRVSYTFTINQSGEQEYTYYSYDAHGNVEWIVQQVNGFTANTAAYEYDLISNKVLKAKYNEGRVDQFYHRYSYDEDNRIRRVETSRNAVVWDVDASYDYYRHGPLKRTELGDDKVQGLDYAYTIQGWLKGVNSPNLLVGEDLGKDGINSATEGAFTEDAYGMSLNYFNGDYIANNVFANANYKVPGAMGLYNGNISAWTDKINKPVPDMKYSGQLTAYRYKYDKLNRIREAEFGNFNDQNMPGNPGWNMAAGETGEYYSNYTYDPNGNLMTLKRNAYSEGGKVEMDIMSYDYLNGTNKLDHVDEAAIAATSHNGNMNDITDQDAGNYEYDAIGNLIKDAAENISIKWNVYGKVSEVIPEQAAVVADQKPHLKFSYDASGNRIKKQLNRVPVFAGGVLDEALVNPTDITITYYSRDASGNVMAIYDRTHEEYMVNGIPVPDFYKAVYKLKEIPMYGSSRLGQVNSSEVIAEKVFHKADFDNISFEVDDFIRKTVLSNVQTALITNESFTNGTDESLIESTTLYTADIETGTLSPGAEYIGSTGNNIAVAEDPKTGVLKFTVVAGNYWGTDNTMLVLDKYNRLMKGSAGLPNDPKAKAVTVKKPGANDEYYLFTRNQVGELFYSTIDMALTGYGNTTDKAGEVTANTQVAGTDFGRHMAVIEDYAKGKSYLFTTRHDAVAHKTTLYRIEITQDGLEEAEPLVEFDSYDQEGEGEIQIAPNGKELYVYKHLETHGFFAHRDAEVRTYVLTADHMVGKYAQNEAVKTYRYGYGNIPKGTVEAGHTSDWMYVAQTSLVNFAAGETTNKVVNKEALVTNSTVNGAEVSTGKTGDIRRAEQGIAYQFNTRSEIFTTWPDGIFFTASNVTEIDLGAKSSGYLPHQPHRIYPKTVDEILVTRAVGSKVYELSDHLSNVRAVVTDAKEATVNGATITKLAADIVGFNNFYAFGSLMPGRNFNSSDYRYGFNGKEKDDEGMGGGGSTYDYGFRIYNPQIGKFLSVDPLSPQYPMLTPYQFASNTPIRFIDLDGLEAADPMAIFWSEVGKTKQSVENSYYTAKKSVSNAATVVSNTAGGAWEDTKEFAGNIGTLFSGDAGIVIYGSGEFKGQIEMGADRNGEKHVQVLDLGNPENVFSVLQLRNTGPSKDAFESLGNVLTDNHPVHSIKIKFDEETEYNYYEQAESFTDKEGTTLYYSPFEDKERRDKNGGRATLYRAVTYRNKETGDITNYGLEEVAEADIVKKE